MVKNVPLLNMGYNRHAVTKSRDDIENRKEMGLMEQECDRLRGLLGLSHEPGTPCGHQVPRLAGSVPKTVLMAVSFKDAGVLILLDGTPDNYKVFLCIRSEQLRRHPGEVCFPGGMRDDEENLQETAIREAEEEVGLLRDDFILLGSLPSFRARFGVLIHPTVALLRRPFFPRLNVHEVQDVFWMPLERFLDDSVHMSFVIDSKYAIHSFSAIVLVDVEDRCCDSKFIENRASTFHCLPNPVMVKFEEAHTFGVTALMCVITAIGVLQRIPPFELSPMLPVSRLARMKPSEVISQVCEYAGQPFATLSKL
ncbi:hydrolase, NUDIX family [Oesophagostomum dentatum]|uniref:Hydrolase, NUDIX family n=1 Tax=Oesophagostomum dentatum TaxID=61180 RepID=A0A0B1T3T1_OESDE|nr:hydrolase, NUDIX family [Oesophagostomum dentatum]